MERKAYPSDTSDEEWEFVVPYLTLMSEEAPQRIHGLREIFNGLRWMIRAGASWRFNAGVFEAIVNDLQMLLRVAAGRAEHPSAVSLDSRTLQSAPESGARAGYDGDKRKKGSKVHSAVDTLGHLLALM